MSLEAILEENTAAHKDTAAAIRELTTVWGKLVAQGKSINQQVDAGTATAVRAGDMTIPVVKSETPVEEKTAKGGAQATPEAPAPAADKGTEPVTYDQVAKAITEGVKKDRQKVVDLLAKFGAKKGPDLKPEQYTEFVQGLTGA